MPNKELVKYFKEGKKEGVSLIDLKTNLLDSGWDIGEIQQALRYVQKEDSGFLKNLNSKNFILFFLVFFLIVGIILFIAFDKEDVVLNQSDLDSGVLINVARKPVNLVGEDFNSKIVLKKSYSEHVKFTLSNKEYDIGLNESISVDLNGNGETDVFIELRKIKAGVPMFYFGSIANNFNENLNNDCSPDWDCGLFGNCVDGIQKRVCVDRNNCGVLVGRPSLTQSCSVVVSKNITKESFATRDEACMSVNENSVYYDDSLVCSTNETDGDFVMNFGNEEISCCSGILISSKEEACSLRGEVYFNSSYDCSSYSVIDYGDSEIKCCVGEPVLKFVRSVEFNQSWDSMNFSKSCDSNFSEKIRNCEAYRCEYIHPLDGLNYSIGVVLDDLDGCHIYSDSVYGSYEYCRINSSFIDDYADYYSGFTDEYYFGVMNLSVSFNLQDLNENPENAKQFAYYRGDCQYIIPMSE